MSSSDMFYDIKDLETIAKYNLDKADLLRQCYIARYVKIDLVKAEKLQKKFVAKYKRWKKYY